MLTITQILLLALCFTDEEIEINQDNLLQVKSRQCKWGVLPSASRARFYEVHYTIKHEGFGVWFCFWNPGFRTVISNMSSLHSKTIEGENDIDLQFRSTF